MFFSAISAVLGLAGTWLSFKGAQDSAKATVQYAKRQQEVAALDARNIERQAAENAIRARVNARRNLARLRGNMGTSGMVFGDSMEDAFVETAGRLELDVQDAARAAAMESQNRRSQGDVALWEGRVRAGAMQMQSYGTLLSDASRMAGNLYNLKS